MQRLQSGMDGTLSRRDLREDEKAKQFLQLQNSLNPFSVTPNLNQGDILQEPKAVTPTALNPVILTPPPTVKSPSPMPSPPKRKRQRIHSVNFLDDDESMQKQRSQCLKSQSHPYKYAKKGES